MSPLEITLVILLVTIIAFVSGKVPFSVISTGIILALILTGIKTPAEAFGGFINTNVVMFVAMFVIGAGLTKTPLIDKAQSLGIRYKDNIHLEGLSQVWYPAGAHPHCRVRIFPADTLSFCLILFSHRSSMRKLHIVNMPFCSALFLKTAIKAAEFFEHFIILSRGLAPSGPLSFCQSFPCVFLQAAESSVFSKVRVCAVERSNESPSGAFKRQNGLAQQDGGASPRQVHVDIARFLW